MGEFPIQEIVAVVLFVIIATGIILLVRDKCENG